MYVLIYVIGLNFVEDHKYANAQMSKMKKLLMISKDSMCHEVLQNLWMKDRQETFAHLLIHLIAHLYFR